MRKSKYIGCKAGFWTLEASLKRRDGAAPSSAWTFNQSFEYIFLTYFYGDMTQWCF
jgi:hypothetical protein